MRGLITLDDLVAFEKRTGPDWQFVRSLGELQVMTRASYLALGVVPLVAGLWSSIPINKSVHLSLVFLLGFFAALFVTIGHVIYQLRAPEIVRRKSLETYVRDARQNYQDQPTHESAEVADQLLRDIAYQGIGGRGTRRYNIHYYPILTALSIAQGKFLEMSKKHRDTEDDLLTQRLYSDSLEENGAYVTRENFRLLSEGRFFKGYQYDHATFELATRLARDFYRKTWISHDLFRDSATVERETLLHNMTRIGIAARAEYLIEADRNWAAMMIATALYLLAILLIGMITIDQTVAVVRAGGLI